MSPDWSRWRSCHLYYHGDGSLLLTHLVGPLVGSLLRADAVDHFFFVRYELGGPHVRLRLRVAPGAEAAAEEAVKRAAADFFARWPSVQPRSAELVRRRTREIMATDPSETDANLYPDNSLRILSFVPEVDRYGGPELLSASLGFFALSSVRALDFAETFGGEPRSRQLPGMLRALAAQALGFARDEPEVLKLLGYATVKPGHPLAPFAGRGDHAFERQPEALRGLLLDVLATGAEAGILDEARRLAADIRSASPAVREGILKSHMHMTANRLGLHNAEEAYLGQMLWRAAQEDGGLAPALRHAWREASGSPLDADRGLEDLLPTAFAAVMKMAVPAAAEAGAFRRR